MAYNEKTGQYYGYIYLITNSINGYRYIGQTTSSDPYDRMKSHIQAAKKNPSIIVDKAIAKYGKDNFMFEVIKLVFGKTNKDMREALDFYEINLIKEYKTSVIYGNGYNVSIGGSLQPFKPKLYDVYNMEGEIIYDSLIPEELCRVTGCSRGMLSQICNGRVGNYHNTYVFRHHGQSFEIYNNEIAIKVLYQYSKDGTLINKYNGGRSEAEKTLGYKIHSINNPYSLCHGYSFSNTGKCEYVGPKRRNKDSYIDVYTLDGIQIFNNMHIYECTKETGINSFDILHVCNGEYTSSHNMVFRYNGDPFDKFSLIKNADRDYSTRTVYCFDITTKCIVYEAKSAKDASRFIGLTFVMEAVDNPNVCVGHYWLSYNNEFKYVGNPYKVSVDVYDKNNNYICTYNSVSECAHAYGIKTTTVSNNCKGKYNNTRQGFVFRYSGDPIDLGKNDSTTPSKRIKLYNIPVACYDKDNNLIKEYDSLSTAAKDMPNGRPNVIRSVCDGFRSTAYNYYWRYVEQSA